MLLKEKSPTSSGFVYIWAQYVKVCATTHDDATNTKHGLSREKKSQNNRQPQDNPGPIKRHDTKARTQRTARQRAKTQSRALGSKHRVAVAIQELRLVDTRHSRQLRALVTGTHKKNKTENFIFGGFRSDCVRACLLYTSPSPRD